jgi:hypothetical protein
MREPTELEKQQYDRIGEIAPLRRQSYLDAGGVLGVVPVDEVGMII